MLVSRFARSIAVHLDGDRVFEVPAWSLVRTGSVPRRARSIAAIDDSSTVLVAVAEGNEPYAADAVEIDDALRTSPPISFSAIDMGQECAPI